MMSSVFVALYLHVYKKLFIFINLHRNWIELLGNFFVIGIYELYIVQWKLRVNM
jgi:hypothetical protein